MKVGDLVIRRLYSPSYTGIEHRSAARQREELGHGLILTKQMSGNPRHACITVYYPKTGQVYDIAESLMEVISENR